MSGSHPLLGGRVDVHYESGTLIEGDDLTAAIDLALEHAPPEAITKALAELADDPEGTLDVYVFPGRVAVWLADHLANVEIIDNVVPFRRPSKGGAAS